MDRRSSLPLSAPRQAIRNSPPVLAIIAKLILTCFRNPYTHCWIKADGKLYLYVDHRISVNDNSYKLYRIWCHEDRRDMSEFIPNSDTRESFNRPVFGSI